MRLLADEGGKREGKSAIGLVAQAGVHPTHGDEMSCLGDPGECEHNGGCMYSCTKGQGHVAVPTSDGGPPPATVDAIVEAACEWWGERTIKDWDEADLARAVIRHSGDWPGCPGCDFECGEPCTPATVDEQLAGVDARIAQLVHEGKLHAPEGYKPPDGWVPMRMPKRSRAVPAPVGAAHCERWPLIELGFGRVEVGEGTHDGRLALIFGRNGTGVLGEPTKPNRAHEPGETLAVVTFANVESVDVVMAKLHVLRARAASENKPEATCGSGQSGPVLSMSMFATSKDYEEAAHGIRPSGGAGDAA